MKQKISKKEIQNRVKDIEIIYQKYVARLSELKKKQSEIINQFIKELEQKKIEEIKKSLK